SKPIKSFSETTSAAAPKALRKPTARHMGKRPHCGVGSIPVGILLSIHSEGYVAMNRRTALAVGTLALSWLGGLAPAADLPSPYMARSSGAAGSALVVDVAGPPADVPPPARDAAPLLPPNDYDGRCCGRGAHVTGGAGLYIMQPHFESNPAFFSIQT